MGSFNVKYGIALASLIGATAANAAPIRLEAESAVLADDHKVEIVENPAVSGGSYVAMKEGNLEFKVSVPETGYYTLWANYMLPTGGTDKIQNLTINGVSAGQISFGMNDEFSTIKGAGKIKLTKGENTIGIVHSWGWVNLDYIELTEYEATPFALSPNPVTPEPTESAKKLYNFLVANFGKKVISGVMTERPFENNGQYTPQTYETQTELKYIGEATGKNVVLVGFDFLHSSGKNSDQQWYQGYTHASIAMAQYVWEQGGIPQFNWHWKDPMHDVEAFYTKSSGNDPYTDFSIGKAYDLTTKKWKTESDEYKAIIRDMDMIADSLLVLQKADVAVLWRPLHEAAGKWFWWGTDGAEACVALYRLMFDYFTKDKGLHNLIWVWTTDEASDALDWYPGNEYVDVVGRDYYYYPREANHSSLVGSFETVKDIFGGRKIIALSENGSVPFPDEMKADGANWSWFMPWYGDYAMDGWANDNTKETWKTVMSSDYVLTLEDMPGWDKYEIDQSVLSIEKGMTPQNTGARSLMNKKNPSVFDLNGKKVKNRASMQNGMFIVK
ncbi:MULTISPECIES: glycosyl hydrolase [unclassified Fibrobacter]|uniref:glycosyl hydrolase n=1 Tax=unclassified Fibrobacter TaxID=2634177 RepID=UPI000D6C4F1B|nr:MULTISPECIES: glycosyl hydrolase [unclassified Fibrobacter]PWJ57074.1 mannan endo-1,4-beta-mannosidase [Fibrobacter sp. UWR4]PZW72280.1 mannan endo-1,4-beta-mannosidase [Fibrobacter sp. UWR1]